MLTEEVNFLAPSLCPLIDIGKSGRLYSAKCCNKLPIHGVFTVHVVAGDKFPSLGGVPQSIQRK